MEAAVLVPSGKQFSKNRILASWSRTAPSILSRHGGSLERPTILIQQAITLVGRKLATISFLGYKRVSQIAMQIFFQIYSNRASIGFSKFA